MHHSVFFLQKTWIFIGNTSSMWASTVYQKLFSIFSLLCISLQIFKTRSILMTDKWTVNSEQVQGAQKNKHYRYFHSAFPSASETFRLPKTSQCDCCNTCVFFLQKQFVSIAMKTDNTKNWLFTLSPQNNKPTESTAPAEANFTGILTPGQNVNKQ